MPIVLFLMIAVIYMLFFLHDCVMMQSYALRRGEALLWQQGEEVSGQNSEDQFQKSVLMMRTDAFSDSVEAEWTDVLLAYAGSYRKSQVQVKGSIHTGISGSAAFLGNRLTSEVSMQTRRMMYVDDYLKTVVLQRVKSEGS